MSPVVDVFMFNDEFDILECRMRELDGVVDVFMAIEGNLTMSGQPKPFRLSDRMLDDPRLKVVRVDLSDISTVQTPNAPPWNGRYSDYWKRDWLQRDVATPVLEGYPGDTIVMYGDVDEIPRRQSVVEFDGPPRVMMMEALIYSTRWTGGTWAGTVIGHKNDLPPYPLARVIRDRYRIIDHGGWHLTWFGGKQAVFDKVRMFAHGELAEDMVKVERRYRDKIRPGTGNPLQPYDGDLPIWIEEGHAPVEWVD